MARKIAVDLLKQHQAKEVLVKLAYSIGVAEAVMATAEIVDQNNQRRQIIVSDYDLTPRGIINFLQLNRPQYSQVARWGSFGQGFVWDR
jgi:S-adenosylmethionine synthetase